MRRTRLETVRKWLELLSILDQPKNLTQIARELGVENRTASEYVDDMEKLGLVVVEYKGTSVVVSRSEKGECVLKCFEEFRPKR